MPRPAQAKTRDATGIMLYRVHLLHRNMYGTAEQLHFYFVLIDNDFARCVGNSGEQKTCQQGCCHPLGNPDGYGIMAQCRPPYE